MNPFDAIARRLLLLNRVTPFKIGQFCLGLANLSELKPWGGVK